MQLGEAYVEVRARTAKYHTAIRQTETATRGAVGRMKATFAGLTAAITRMAGALGLVVGIYGMVRFFKSGAAAAADFEKQMAMVSTMLDDTAAHMPRFTKGIADMAKRFGQGTDTLSKGLYDILSASISASKAMDVLDASARAAIAGISQTGTAADVLTTLLNAFKLSADHATSVGDKLFAVVKRGKTTFDELAQHVGLVASAASVAGMSIDEMGASIATMTRSGIHTAEAVTSLISTLRTFMKPTNETIAAAAKFGITLDDTTLKTLGFLGLLKKMRGAGIRDLAEVFPNVRAIKGVAALFQDLAGMEYDIRLLAQSGGMMQEAFDKMAQTTSFRLGQVRERWVAVGRTVGAVVLKLVVPVMERAVAVMEKFAEWVDKVAQRFETDLAPAVQAAKNILASFGQIVVLNFKAAFDAVNAFGKVINEQMGGAQTIINALAWTIEKLSMGLMTVNAYIEAGVIAWKGIFQGEPIEATQKKLEALFDRWLKRLNEVHKETQKIYEATKWPDIKPPEIKTPITPKERPTKWAGEETPEERKKRAGALMSGLRVALAGGYRFKEPLPKAPAEKKKEPPTAAQADQANKYLEAILRLNQESNDREKREQQRFMHTQMKFLDAIY